LIYCGIDWAERTHDVALVDDTGQLLAKRHITDDAAGYRNLMDLLAEYGDTEETPIPVAIETSRGLLVAVLRAGKRKVFAINPMAAARYRDRHAVSRSGSPGESHPRAPSDPYVTVSRHTALVALVTRQPGPTSPRPIARRTSAAASRPAPTRPGPSFGPEAADTCCGTTASRRR
jgi:hypothetical protein